MADDVSVEERLSAIFAIEGRNWPHTHTHSTVITHMQICNLLCYCRCQMGIAHTPRSLARNAPILSFTRDDDAAWTTKLLDAKPGWKRSQLEFACSLVALQMSSDAHNHPKWNKKSMLAILRAKRSCPPPSVACD